MNTQHSLTDIEKKLFAAAHRLPEPTRPLPISPAMKERQSLSANQAKTTAQSSRRTAQPIQRTKQPLRQRLSILWNAPAWRAAVIALVILCVGTTTALAASPQLRQAVIRFLTSGTVEQPPVDILESSDSYESDTVSSDDDTISSGDTASDNPMAQEGSVPGSGTEDMSASNEKPPVQKVGSLTLTQTTTLDSHFTATYASSSDFLSLLKTPSGTPIFCTQPAEGVRTYYVVENGSLQELALEQRSLTASVQLQTLPGVMNHDGKTDLYKDLQLPTMDFTVFWQQYGMEVLIDNSETDYRFDIGSTFGVDLGWDYDGRFYSSAIPGRGDLIQVFFNLDGQQTGYHYPFLLDLTTGEVTDPLAEIDFSAYPCITDLRLADDLTHATAMAGSDHDHLHEILIDLTTGQIHSAADSEEPTELPVSDCLVWFAVDEHLLFYATGSETAADGFLYDTRTQTATPLFTDAAQGYNLWDEGTFDRYFSTIGGGYLLYHEGNSVSLLDLHDGTWTLLEGIPVSHRVHYFFNNDFSVLSISIDDEDPDRFLTERLCFLDMVTKEAWYFDRDLPQNVEETSHSWYSPYGYMITARNEETDTHYLYLYQYSPE